jgi:hypothetical protein
MRHPTTASVLGLLLSCLLITPAFAEDPAKPTILDTNLPEVRFQQIALKDALDFLKDISGATFQVDWKAFKAQKLTEKAPVSVDAKNKKLSEVLTQLFVAAGANSDPQLTAKEKKVSIKPGKQSATTKPAADQ